MNYIDRLKNDKKKHICKSRCHCCNYRIDLLDAYIEREERILKELDKIDNSHISIRLIKQLLNK